MHETLLYVFTIVDDFCCQFEDDFRKRLLKNGNAKRSGRIMSMTMSEIMTILLAFQLSDFRHFKGFYMNLEANHGSEFPQLVSYSRFVTLMKSAMIPMVGFFEFVKGVETDSYFIDATALAVSKNKRIYSHKVFKTLAKRGKSSMGWFFGFKLHLVCNQQGAPIDFRLTPGNIDDRVAAKKLMNGLRGTIVGDKGYISKALFKKFFGDGLRIVTAVRKNMKPQLVTLKDSAMISSRSLIESVFNVLKNSMHLEHSRHRSVANFMVNLLSTISAFAVRGMNSGLFKKNCISTLAA